MRLTDVFDECVIEYKVEGSHHHSSRGFVNTDCPFCSPRSNRFRLGWSLNYRFASCWTCGKVDRLDALVQLSGRSPTECLGLLRNLDGDYSTPLEKPVGKLVLPTGLGPLQNIHKSYLRMRGFDPDELVKLWGIQGIGLHSSLAWRIFIPVHFQGKVVSWTTRAVTDDTRYRYVTAKAEEESMRAKDILYGECFVRHAVIIVEGPIDAWRMGPGAVALMGLSYTRAQVSRIAKYPVRCVVFDSEPRARMRAKQLCQALEVFPGSTHQVELSSADPGSASKKEIQLLRKSFLG